MNWHEQVKNVQDAAIFIAAVTAIALFLLKGLRLFRKFWSNAAHVYYEVTPNGGGSIKDSVARIETALYETKETVKTTNLLVSLVEQRQRIKLNWYPDGIFELDAVGALISCNRTLTLICACSGDDILGFGWRNCLHPDDRERVAAEWLAAVRDCCPYASRQRFIQRDCNGNTTKTVEVMVTADVLRDSDCKVSGWFGYVHQLADAAAVVA